MNQDKDQEDFQTRGNQPPSPSPSPSSPSPRSLPSPCLSNIAGVVKYRNILLGVTGSVAAVKAPEVAVRLCREVVVDEEAEIVVVVKIKILLTAGASNFWEQSKQYNEYWWNELQSELQNTNIDNNNNNNNRNNNDNTGHNNNNNNNNNKDNNHNHNAAHNMDNSSNTRISRIEVLHCEDEWRSWNELGDSVMHIDLRNWADCFVIAPLSAHSMAKLAHGFCDDALSSVARAWDFEKPMILAPAMNTFMWEHPLTKQQLETIQGFFLFGNRGDQDSSSLSGLDKPTGICHIVQPQVKTLACGQVGNGALAPISDIVDCVRNTLLGTKTQVNVT